MNPEDEFSRWNTMNIPHHLIKYGYIGIWCTDIDRMLKVIKEYYDIDAEVKSFRETNTPGVRDYLIVRKEG